jgi:uncharacterized repeat protein (TIGR03803 family)
MTRVCGSHRYARRPAAGASESRVAAAILVLMLAITPLARSQTLTVLHAFSGADGANPLNGNLARDAAGNLYGTTGNGGNLNACSGFGCGVVFKLDPAGDETILHSFNGVDGDGIFSGVIFGAAGKLYGTSEGPGNGTVFEVGVDGQFSVLYGFEGTPDGSMPYDSLITDGDGNFYGTTWGGGYYGAGSVFKVAVSGRDILETVLHSFGGKSGDGGGSFASLARDAAGNLFGVADYGGTYSLGSVFEVTSSGEESVLHSFGGAGDGTNPLASMVLDAQGNLYGTTAAGGSAACEFGCGTIFKLNPAGKEEVLYRFGGQPDGQFPYASLLPGRGHIFYGTTWLGGAYGHGTIFQVDEYGDEEVLYSFTGGADGAAPSAGLIQDDSGNLYGTASGGGAFGDGVVFEFTP